MSCWILLDGHNITIGSRDYVQSSLDLCRGGSSEIDVVYDAVQYAALLTALTHLATSDTK